MKPIATALLFAATMALGSCESPQPHPSQADATPPHAPPPSVPLDDVRRLACDELRAQLAAIDAPLLALKHAAVTGSPTAAQNATCREHAPSLNEAAAAMDSLARTVARVNGLHEKAGASFALRADLPRVSKELRKMAKVGCSPAAVGGIGFPKTLDTSTSAIGHALGDVESECALDLDAYPGLVRHVGAFEPAGALEE